MQEIDYTDAKKAGAATFATAARVACACDEFWRRPGGARKRDSAERAAIFFFFFFLAIPGKPMRTPDEKQRSNKVHPNRECVSDFSFSNQAVHFLLCGLQEKVNKPAV